MSSTADQRGTKRPTNSARERLAEAVKGARERKHLTLRKLSQLLLVPESTLRLLEDPRDTELSIAHAAGLAQRIAPLVNLSKRQLDPIIAELHAPMTRPLSRRQPLELASPVVISRAGVGFLIGVALALVGGYAVWQVRTLTSAPPLSLSSPASNMVTDQTSVAVEGRSAPDSTVLVNGDPVPLGTDGRFTATVYLQPGYNSLDVTAINSFSRRGRVQRVIYYQP